MGDIGHVKCCHGDEWKAVGAKSELLDFEVSNFHHLIHTNISGGGNPKDSESVEWTQPFSHSRGLCFSHRGSRDIYNEILAAETSTQIRNKEHRQSHQGTLDVLNVFCTSFGVIKCFVPMKLKIQFIMDQMMSFLNMYMDLNVEQMLMRYSVLLLR